MKKYNLNAEKSQEIESVWTQRKIENKEYHSLITQPEVITYLDWSDKKLEKIDNCGTYFNLWGDETLSNTRLVNDNGCRSRFCPRCQTLKARKDAIKLATIVNYLRAEYKYEFIFLTLTVPNCEGEDLSKTIDLLNKSLVKLFKKKKYNWIKGYLKKIEVTYNKDTDTYHPHLHILIAVAPSYFKSRYYLSTAVIREDWGKVTKIKTPLQVKTQKVKVDDMNAVMEMSKYSAKSEDYLHNGNEVFITFVKSLTSRRLFNFSGCFKEGLKKYERNELGEYFVDKDVRYIWELTSTWMNNETKYHSTWNLINGTEQEDKLIEMFGDKLEIIEQEKEENTPKINRLQNNLSDIKKQKLNDFREYWLKLNDKGRATLREKYQKGQLEKTTEYLIDQMIIEDLKK